MDDRQRELDVLIRARYPVLYIVSWEEPRVIRTLRQIARQHEKEIFCWSITEGWTTADGRQPVRLSDAASSTRRASATRKTRSATVEIDQALEALDLIEQWGESPERSRGAIFVLKDFDPYITAPTIERRLRDLSLSLPYSSYKTIVITSPVLKVPSHLEKDITVIDYELPEYRELEAILDRIIGSVKQGEGSAVDMDAEGKEAFVKAALGLTSAEAENVFAKALVMDGKLERLDVDVVLSEKKQVVRKSGTLEYYESDARFANIGGLSALKDWLRKRKTSFSEKARAFGLPEPRGVLLIGVQGCGKSLAAKAVGALWELPLLRFDVGSIFGRYVGESEGNMRKALAVAEAVAPCVLWIDELEKGFSGMSGGEDSGTSARVLSYFLTWLQERKKPVFVIATANDVTKLPPELLRKGRLDEIFFIDLPSRKERTEIFNIHLRIRNREPEKFNIDQLVTESIGFSGSEIEQAVIGSLYDAFDADRDINTEDITGVLQVTVPISRTMDHKIRELREWADERARPASFPEDLDEQPEAGDLTNPARRKRRELKVKADPPAPVEPPAAPVEPPAAPVEPPAGEAPKGDEQA